MTSADVRSAVVRPIAPPPRPVARPRRPAPLAQARAHRDRPRAVPPRRAELAGAGRAPRRTRDRRAAARRAAHARAPTTPSSAALGSDGLIGFGEAYMAGDWDADDLAAVLDAVRGAARPSWCPRGCSGCATSTCGTSRRRARTRAPARARNIERALRPVERAVRALPRRDDDLLLARGSTHARRRSLADAQRRKVDALLDAAGVGARHAGARDRHRLGRARDPRRAARRARHHAHAVASEQAASPAQRVAARRRRPTASTCSCATTATSRASYDAIVSVEMIEAVGERVLADLLRARSTGCSRPAARSGVQAILLEHDRHAGDASTSTPGSSKYIFPGGALPSLRAIDEIVREHTDAAGRPSVDAFGADYARTLRRWRERFDAHAGEVDALGFDATVPPHVGLLPRVLRGRLRHRLPRRRPDSCCRSEARMSSRRPSPRRSPATVRRLVGDDLPVAVAGVGRQRGRPGRRARASCSATGARCGACSGSPDELGLARGLRHRRPRRRGRPRRRLPPGVGVRPRARSRRCTSARATGSTRVGTAVRLGVFGLPPPPPGLGGAHPAAGCTAAPRPRRHRAPLRPVERLLRAAARRVAWRTRARTSPSDDAGVIARRRAAGQARARVHGSSSCEPGMRLLDVGCGWGSLSIHAAREHGVHVTGVTLSREQLDFARKRVADHGLRDLVDFRLQDYRDLDDGPYDAAASIEMGEHVGDEQYPTFVGDRAPRARGRAAGCSCSRCRAPRATRRAAARSSRRTSRPTCTCARWARPSACSRTAASRCATCRRCASTTCAPARRGWPRSRRAGTRSSRSSARRWRGCGGSTWSVASLAFEEGRMGVDQILGRATARARRDRRERLRHRRVPRRRRRSPPARSLVLMLATWLLGQRGRALQRDRRRVGPRLRAWSRGSRTALSVGHGDDTRRLLVAVLVTIWGLPARGLHRVAQPGQGRGPALRRRCSTGHARPGAARARRSTSPRPSRSGSSRCRCRWRCSRPASPACCSWVGTAVWAGRLRLRERRRLAARTASAPTRRTRAR